MPILHDILPAEFYPLRRRTPDPRLPLLQSGEQAYYLASSPGEVNELALQGLEPPFIHYAGPWDNGAAEKVLGLCRCVASSWEELQQLNEAALKHNRPGFLEVAGIAVVPDMFKAPASPSRLSPPPGFAETAISELSRRSKNELAGLSIRGCYLRPYLGTGLQGGELRGRDLAAFFHEAYQVAKRLTVQIPCTMPFVAFPDLLSSLEICLSHHPEDAEVIKTAADIIGLQNKTAFYSRLLIN